MLHLRKAVLTDMPALLEGAKQFVAYLDNTTTVWDEDRMQQILTTLILQNYLTVALKDGVVAGAIGAFISPSLWSTSITIMEECFWWVNPNVRIQRVGYLLLKDFITYAKEHNHKPIMHLLSHSPVNIKSLEKLGFKLKEHTFYME